jgi:hypothetical protein
VTIIPVHPRYAIAKILFSAAPDLANHAEETVAGM